MLFLASSSVNSFQIFNKGLHSVIKWVIESFGSLQNLHMCILLLLIKRFLFTCVFLSSRPHLKALWAMLYETSLSLLSKRNFFFFWRSVILLKLTFFPKLSLISTIFSSLDLFNFSRTIIAKNRIQLLEIKGKGLKCQIFNAYYPTRPKERLILTKKIKKFCNENTINQKKILLGDFNFIETKNWHRSNYRP